MVASQGIMKKYGTVILLSFLIALVDGQSDVGGTTAPDGKYPYQAALKRNSKFLCGASIINERWLLTAAHCLKHIKDPATASILVGTNKAKGGSGTEYGVLRTIMHKDYDKRYIHSDDIGLIKVDSPIIFNKKVQPIRLPKDNYSNYEGLVALLAGWGTFKKKAPPPTDLQHVKLRVYSQQKCAKEWKQARNRTITGSQLCTSGKTEENLATQGDSGGPLVIDGEQVGVVSFAWLGLPDIFTRVGYYLPWIYSHVKVK